METTEILNLAPYIEHTLLKPEATSSQIQTLCHEALEHSFKGVCVNSSFVSLAQTILKNSSAIVVSVVGFPLGACHSNVKRYEAIIAAEQGAQEIDMVIALGLIKESQWSLVAADIQTVTSAVNIPVKVILETDLLTSPEIIKACEVAELAGAQFVKTCTGFIPGGATVEHVAMMKKALSTQVQVKASGGIKTQEQALALIQAGATRLGTSSGVQIVQGQTVGSNTY